METAPMVVSYESMERAIARAYRKSGDLPEKYPNVERIDDIVYRTEFLTQPTIREKILKYFIINLVYGFDRDKLWHELNPGYETPTVYNIYHYITTPYLGKDQLSYHVNIWDEKDSVSDEQKEDIQASFEYMQGMMIDGEFFTLIPPRKSEIKQKILQISGKDNK